MCPAGRTLHRPDLVSRNFFTRHFFLIQYTVQGNLKIDYPKKCNIRTGLNVNVPKKFPVLFEWALKLFYKPEWLLWFYLTFAVDILTFFSCSISFIFSSYVSLTLSHTHWHTLPLTKYTEKMNEFKPVRLFIGKPHFLTFYIHLRQCT